MSKILTFLLAFSLSIYAYDSRATDHEMPDHYKTPTDHETPDHHKIPVGDHNESQHLKTSHESHSDEKGKIYSIILVPDKESLNPDGYETAEGVEILIDDFPGNRETLCRELFGYMHQPISKEVMMCIKKVVIRHYRDAGRPIINVTIPEQDITHGSLQVMVTESCLGCVSSKCNQWFSSSTIEGYISACPGDAIRSDELNVDLFWMNRNPFRRTDAVFTKGACPNSTDIELVTTDRLPVRTYTGIDNTGNDITGNNRWFAGINWGNALWLDQQLSYQFTMNPSPKRLKSHTVHWMIPLPWRNTVTFYGGYSSTDGRFDTTQTSVSPSRFRSHGWSAQASMRYDIPIYHDAHQFLSEFTWGVDWKRTNNNLEFSNVPVIGDIVNIFQFVLGYNAGYESSLLTSSFELKGTLSPGRLLSDQSTSDYSTIQPFASATYFYLRGAYSLIFRAKYLDFHNYLRGQVASNTLLPTEQYGLGGYDTVRGYKERIFNADSAVVYNIELRSAVTKVLGHFWCGVDDEFQLIGFFDLGYGDLHKVLVGETTPRSATLYSIGPGIRYNLIPWLTLRADWGFQLHTPSLGTSSLPYGPHQRIHFSLIGGY